MAIELIKTYGFQPKEFDKIMTEFKKNKPESEKAVQ